MYRWVSLGAWIVGAFALSVAITNVLWGDLDAMTLTIGAAGVALLWAGRLRDGERNR